MLRALCVAIAACSAAALAVPATTRAKLRVVVRGRDSLAHIDDTINEYARVLSNVLGERCTDADGCLAITVEWSPAAPGEDALQLSLTILQK